MADKANAIKNDLNRRAREVGIFNQELTLDDLAAVRAFYDFTCLKCGKNPATSIDHVKPLSKGGTNTRDNLQLLCTNHNKAKGDEEIDYRNGKVCPDDFTAPNAQEKTYKTKLKYDWGALRFEYETNETLSLRALAQKHGIFYTLLLKRSASEGWHKSKQKFGSDLVSTVEQELREAVAKSMAEREISARGLLFDVIESAVEEWQNKPKASLADLAALLKLGLAAQNVPTDHVVTETETDVDDSDFIRAAEQVTRRADRRRETEVYYDNGEAEEGMGAGWSD